MPGQGIFIIPALPDLITSMEKLLPSPAPFLEWEFLLTLLCQYVSVVVYAGKKTMFQFIGHRKMKIPGLGGALHICTFPRNHEFRAGFRVYGVILKLSPFVGNEMFHVFQEVYLWAWGCSEGWDCSLISLISFFFSVLMFQILGVQPETTFSSIPCHQGGYDHVTNFWPMGFNWK